MHTHADGSAPPRTVDQRKARLRDANLRATGPRLAVLRVIEACLRPLTHAEVMAALDEGGAWDRATIYRNLNDMTEAGLLRRFDLGDHVWRFELAEAAPADEHHADGVHPHFVCTSCGDVQCLDEVVVHVQAEGRVPRSVAAAAVAIQLSGRCDTCG